MIELELPWPPTINHYKRVGALTRTKSGKLYQKKVNTPETNRFYYAVWAKVMGLKAQQGGKFFGSATIALEINAHPPDARKRDISNVIKVLEDSLQRAGLFEDDFQIARLLIERKDIILNGMVKVRVYELEPK